MATAQIMVVEDESIISKDIQQTLKALGYGIAAVAFSGKEAIRKAEETRPDLILMDIVLKGDLDGIETAGQIHTGSDVPIIYLTAYTDEKTLQRAKITEPCGYILKPFQERELYTSIEMALYKHRIEKTSREELERKVRERTGELVKANETLRLFEEAIETLPLGLTITDEHGNIIYTNPAEAGMHGYQVEELIGKDVRMLAPRELWNQMSAEQLVRMNRWKRESVNLRKEGTSFPVQLLSVVATNVAGH